jgi:hypothetical protein
MIDVLPFSPSHLDQMQKMECHNNESPPREPKPDAAETIFIDGNPVSCFGAHEWFPGVWQVWGIVGVMAKHYPFEYHRFMKQYIHQKMIEFEARRFQMSVRADYREGIRWAEALGFVREGTMKHYGHDGTDYLLYARYME